MTAPHDFKFDADGGTSARSRVATAWSAWPGRLLRAAFAILPLGWLARRLDLRAVAHDAAAVGGVTLFLSFLAVFSSVLVGCVRWRWMLFSYGAHSPPPLGDLLRHNLVGQYFNVLPSGVAGDAVRGHRVRHCLPDAATSYTVIFVERLAGLLGLCTIAAVAMAASESLRTGPLAWTLDLAVLGGVTLTLVSLGLPSLLARHASLRATVARIPVVGGVIVRVPPPRSLTGLFGAVGLSVVTQGALVVSVALLIRRLSAAAGLVVCARVVPGVILFTYVPLTPGGVGQREWAFAYLFGQAGVAREAAVATSLLFFALMMSLAALGGLSLVGERAVLSRAAARMRNTRTSSTEH